MSDIPDSSINVNNEYEKKLMDTQSKFSSIKYTEEIKKVSSSGTQVVLGLILLALIGYTGYLFYSLLNNISINNKCKYKPSATDASFTCPGVKDNQPPFYMVNSNKVDATLFYGAVERPIS